MYFDTNLIKIGGELRKLWITEYFNIGGMGAAILNINEVSQNFKIFVLFVLGFYSPVNNEVMSSRSVNSGTVPGQAYTF